MPYITPELRDEIDPALDTFVDRLARELEPGELNYIITRLLLSQQPVTYGDINMLIGVLECAKLELYRRVAVPYESNKIKQNGDVYP